MGDALAVTLLEARGFTKQDFARSHPGGSLGRQLLLHVEDLMRTGAAIPKTTPEEKLRDGLLEMSRKGLGMTVIVGLETWFSVYSPTGICAGLLTNSWTCIRRR